MIQPYLKIKKHTNTFLIGLTATFLISFLFFSFLSPIQSVFANNPTNGFDQATYTRNDGAVITVTDPTKINSISGETITVTVKSDTNPTGVQVTLTESGDTGVFTNKALVFANGIEEISPGAKVTVKIKDSFLNGATNVEVHSLLPDLSGDDGAPIIPFVVTETSPGSGIFQAVLKTTTGPTSGNSIHVSAGDLLEVINTRVGMTSYTLVSPPVAGTDALRANIGDTISVFSNGVLLDTATIIDGGGEQGGGGGGLLRPGLVLDILLGIGGGPFVVSPPSFGGGLLNYSDGLTIVQNGEKHTFDISKYNQDINKQVLVAGVPVNMTLKMYDPYNINAIIHSGLYLITSGSDMITSNSIASIVYDKGSKIEINDPSNLLTNASATPSTDGKFQYVSFYFIPTRSYEKMSFLNRAWNDHLYSTDVRFYDAAASLSKLDLLPTGFTKYDNFHDLVTLVDKEGFEKPQIMGHIHSATDVFPSNEGGYVYWLYDSTRHAVTLIISDKEGNTLYSSTDPLLDKEIQPKGNYGFMKFTVNQLNRNDVVGEQEVMKQEEAKAMEMKLLTEGYHRENGIWIK